MKDWIHSILKTIDYERGKVMGVLIALITIAVIAGCPLQTKSPISGGTVTPTEWVIEVQREDAKLSEQAAEIERARAAYNAQIVLLNDQDEAVAAEFNRQAALRQKILDTVGGVVTTMVSGGVVDWSSILTSGLALGGIGLGVGGIYDSKRKNAVIAEKKNAVTLMQGLIPPTTTG
jgi:hypothetical protein